MDKLIIVITQCVFSEYTCNSAQKQWKSDFSWINVQERDNKKTIQHPSSIDRLVVYVCQFTTAIFLKKWSLVLKV